MLPPLVLVLSNFDRIFDYPALEIDCCGLLHSWHEDAKSKPLWQLLRLVIVHSQKPYAVRDINQSPFNVGTPIKLEGFTLAQAQHSAVQQGVTLTESQLSELVAWVEGHPYLIRLALYYLATGKVT